MTSSWKKTFSLKGKMAEAMRYLRSQRRSLLTFLRDGRVPIDNNACERAIRPIAIGRNNRLFAGSEDGGETAAILYTIVESARASGVDPQDYLLNLLRRIGTHPASRVSELTPWATAAELQPYRGHRSVAERPHGAIATGVLEGLPDAYHDCGRSPRCGGGVSDPVRVHEALPHPGAPLCLGRFGHRASTAARSRR